MATIAETPSIKTGVIPLLRKDLGAPNNSTLFPEHFLKATLLKIGGKIEVYPDGSIEFYFPSPRGGVTRMHRGGEMTCEPGSISPLDGVYTDTHCQVGNLDIGHPNLTEAMAIRQLQKGIWDTDVDRLYPVDIHSDQFGLPTSLVARISEEVVGFLFGFWRKNESGWQIESQLAGVPDRFSGQGIGFQLKVEQAILALKSGIDIITWTADPLQLRNAKLNFNKLCARATRFFPDLYSFAGANIHNQTPASRFEFRWELSRPKVAEIIHTRQPVTSRQLKLNDYPDIAVVSSPYGIPQAPHLAVPIPANWTEMQQDTETALRLRSETDAIFSQIIGPYAVIAVAFDENQVPYLIAEKNDE